MKRALLLLLAVLFLAGCAGQTGNAGQGSGTDYSELQTESAAEKFFSIRYELGDTEDDFLATPTNAKAGDLVEIRTQVLIDADIHVYLDNEKEVQKSHYDSDYWGYSFTMPSKDVLVTAKPYTKEEIWGIGVDSMNIVQGVQYIRTDGYIDGESYPKTFWISSVEELQSYYEANKAKYWLDGNEFAAAMERYDASFFNENDLIVVLLEEGSGSNRYEVTGVKVSPSPNDGKQYVIQPEIKRLVPECGTCDMAEWHIIIEIGKDHGMSVSELQEPIFTVVTLAG